MRISATPISGLILIERERAQDERGFFSRFFCSREMAAIGFDLPIAQINHTHTRRRGSVRGLHYQCAPFSEDKIVSCLRGEVFDVALDLRREAPTFLHWHAQVLSADNARSLLIPQGFAHGFQTLSDDCEMVYLHSRPFAPDSSGAINVRDPRVAIDWPLAFADISPRDSNHPFLPADYEGL